jgi:hypothetical protein
MTRIERPASDFKELCAVLGYRRKSVVVVPTNTVTLQGLNWDSGSKSLYSAVSIATNKAVTAGYLGNPHPMQNENEGAKIAIPPGVVICEHGTFMGKPSRMTIYVHPDNMPQFVESANV